MTSLTLYEYLHVTFTDGLSYPDAVQLCLGLYMRSDLISSLVSAESLTKEGISMAFAEFARHGRVSCEGLSVGVEPAVTKDQHWVEVIESIFRTSDNILNLSRVRELLTPSISDDYKGSQKPNQENS